MKKLKVAVILGTRPEIIRLSAVIATLDRFTELILIHTGQNYDFELNELHFQDLEVRKPDYFLSVCTDSLGTVLGEILIKTEQVLLKEKPDAFLALGDTNSAIGLLMAKRMKIPTYHMEAGNRSFDANVPEEVNRKMVDHLSDFNLVYTEHARRHLLSEGIPHRFIYLTGSPMREVLNKHTTRINQSDILDELGLVENQYFLVSVHREENVDSKENLERILECLKTVHAVFSMPVVVSTHPRTRQRLEAFGLNLQDDLNGIQFLNPFGFLDYNKLQKCAKCTVSDSGTISEEASILGFNAVSIRRSIERPEALDSGSIVLTGFDPDILVSSINTAIYSQEEDMLETPVDYQVKNTSMRVLKLILGTAKLANTWKNLQDFNRYDNEA